VDGRLDEWAESWVVSIFVCGLFNDAVSSSDSTEQNDSVINELDKKLK
jgi:hypothetical protein